MENLSGECTIIETALSENVGDLEEHGVLTDELETTKLILQKQLFVRNLGASRSFRVQVDWTTIISCPGGLVVVQSPWTRNDRDAPMVVVQSTWTRNDRDAPKFLTQVKNRNACKGVLTSLSTARAKEFH